LQAEKLENKLLQSISSGPATSLENIHEGPYFFTQNSTPFANRMAPGLLFHAVGLYAPACAPAVPFRRRAVRED
jgi:hypothetical protein